MAYGLRYQSVYTNELQQDVTISLLQKDFVGDVDSFVTRLCRLSDSSDENSIIARECQFTIHADSNTDITWETFLTGSYDEWKVVVEMQSHKMFEGFLTPEEGASPFLDKPYDVELRATNGLKLLKDVPFPFIKGKYLLSDILAMALSNTLLELPIRIYGSIYNENMDDRGDDIAATYWNQTKFDHRTLMKSGDAISFLSCYEVILKMIKRHSRLMYFDGKWLIFYSPEHQYAPGGLFYTDFDKDGVVIGGAQDIEGYASVGKSEAIFPINEDAQISSTFPIKFSQTDYMYNVWPELPLNNKFERGTFIFEGLDPDGNTVKFYTIDDWTTGRYDGNPSDLNMLPNFNNANPDSWARISTYNVYGIELKREVAIERTTGGGSRWVQSEGIPVNAGDKIRVSFDWRTTANPPGPGVPVQLIVYLIQDITGTKYTLRSKEGDVTNAKWEIATPNIVGIYTTPNSDTIQYQSISVESPIFPVNGTMYIVMLHSGSTLPDNSTTYYKGLTIEYIPFVAGGFIPVSGDYWKHQQNANQLDADADEIEISDTIIRVLQGCFFDVGGVLATTPTWYNYGEVSPTLRHFKELVDKGRYNLGWRRFKKIEGTFIGLFYSPIDDQLNMQPVSFHKNYVFSDLGSGEQFILLPPLSMDLVTGEIKATFREVYKDSNDGTQEGDTKEYNYIFRK